MYIYKITNLLNGKLYIGKTESLDPQTRWRRHLYETRRGTGGTLYGAMRKHGANNFKFEVIDGTNSSDELKYKEVHYIHSLNTLSPNGYNLVLGTKIHYSTKLKIAKKAKNNTDLEFLSKLREKSKEKIQVKVRAINVLNNNIVIFESVKDCSKIKGVNSKYLGEILNGKKLYKSYCGYYFEYVNKPTKKKTKRKTKIDIRKEATNEREKIYGNRKCTFVRSVKKTHKVTGEIKIYLKTKDVEVDGFKLKTIRTYLYETRNNKTEYNWELI